MLTPTHLHRRWCTVLALSALLALPAALARAVDLPSEFDLGFIASRLKDADGNLKFRALGPLFERTRYADTNSLLAVRPFYSRYNDVAAERRSYDICWPIADAKRFRNEFSWRFLVAWYLDYNINDPRSKYRFWALPIYFQGRDERERSYVAVFPIGGRIYGFLGREDVSFFLFPLTLRTQIDNIKTRDYLWPIYSRTKGPGVDGLRVFPFYGYSIREKEYEKRFALWPIWTWARFDYPRQSGSGYILFPLWGHQELSDQKTWWVIPPFFRFTKAERMNRVMCPWPFIQFSSGETERTSFWPIYERKSMQGVTRSSYLWPIFWTERVDRGDVTGKRFLALPFYQSEVRTQLVPGPGKERETVYRDWMLWPLMSYYREGDQTTFRCLNLWPLRHTRPIERSYAPIWTLLSHHATGDSADDEFLWGLYRRQRIGDQRNYMSLFPLVSWDRDDRNGHRFEWQLLKGLIGYERQDTQRTFRVLYLLHFRSGEKQP